MVRRARELNSVIFPIFETDDQLEVPCPPEYRERPDNLSGHIEYLWHCSLAYSHRNPTWIRRQNQAHVRYLFSEQAVFLLKGRNDTGEVGSVIDYYTRQIKYYEKEVFDDFTRVAEEYYQRQALTQARNNGFD